ncbi:hypothetical protein B296_00049273 [Ensete ventricosum]|uniref:Uncharacterized protein n=1 Tax=Ensete ventricosum TaxID=4639 RepID=A0A426YRE2_ENSVE|nr:hypothetical protein B296_00049273 [Ensete ventricosum]
MRTTYLSSLETPLLLLYLSSLENMNTISRMQQKTFISNLLTLSLLRLPSFFAADHHPLTCSLLSIVAQARGPYHPYDIDDKVRDPNSAIVKCEAEIVSEENERSKMHALLMAGELDKEGEDDGEPHAEESCRQRRRREESQPSGENLTTETARVWLVKIVCRS